MTPQRQNPTFPAVTFCNDNAALSFSIPATAGTLAGFRAWALSDDFPERGKIAFVSGGVIVDMSPESMEEHSDIKIDALGKEIEFQLLTRGEDEYVAVEPRHGWLASPTFDREFRLVREKDSDSSWQYTLRVRERAPSGRRSG